MRFAFDAEQLELRDALRDVLEKECPPEVARSPHDPRLWKQLAEMGVIGLRRELDELGLVLLLEEAGRALVPGPFLATAAVGIPALNDGRRSDWAERAAAGDAVIALGLRGEMVAFADVADLFVLEADGALHAVPRDRVELERAEQVPRLCILRLPVACLPVEAQALCPRRRERGQQPERLDRERIERVRRLRLVPRADQVPSRQGVVRRVEPLRRQPR